MNASIASAASIVLVGTGSLVNAAVITTPVYTTGTAIAYSVSGTDLINTGSPTLGSAVITDFTAFSGASASNLNSGNPGLQFADLPSTTFEYEASGDGTPGVFSATYNLDLTTAAAGYDIQSIATFAGWAQGGRWGQNYDVSVSLIGSPAFAPLTLVGYNPVISSPESDASGVSTKVVLTDSGGVLATGVDAVRVDFKRPPSNVLGGLPTVWREVDVVGVATVPEPTALAGLSLLGAAALRRRRA